MARVFLDIMSNASPTPFSTPPALLPPGSSRGSSLARSSGRAVKTTFETILENFPDSKQSTGDTPLNQFSKEVATLIRKTVPSVPFTDMYRAVKTLLSKYLIQAEQGLGL